MQVLQAAPELVKEAAPLAPAVSPVLADAVAKAATRSEGISALLILATLAAQDAAASEHCEKQKVKGCPKLAAFRLDGISFGRVALFMRSQASQQLQVSYKSEVEFLLAHDSST